MSKETNIAARETFGEAVNTGNFDLDHDLVLDQGRGPEGFKTANRYGGASGR